MRGLTVLLFGAGIGLACAAETATEIDRDQSVKSFAVADIASVAGSLGYQSEVIAGGGGQRIVGLHAKNGIGFIAMPTACMKDQPAKCFGLELQASYGIGAGIPLEVLNDFNVKRVFTQAYRDGSGIKLSHYEIADYGIPLGNIAVNLSVFAAIAEEFRQALTKAGASASLQSPEAGTGTRAFTLRKGGDVRLQIPLGGKAGDYVNKISP